MPGIIVLLVLLVGGLAVWRQLKGSVAQVRDASGRPVGPGPSELLRNLGIGLAVALLLVTAAGTFRVVPVGHALVIFNTVTKGFTIAGEGVAFVPPFVSSTQVYDLRRLEYTMSGQTGEGRKSDVDDSIWSPTKEGLQEIGRAHV